MDKKINWNIIGKLIPIIGLIIFIYIITNIGIYKIIDSFSKIPIIYFLLASILTIPRVFLYSIKWKYICDKQKFNLKLPFLIKVFLITFFYANITPGAIGCHIRAYYLKRKSNATLGKCLANSLIDLQIGSIAGIFLSLVGAIIIFDKSPGIFPIILAFFIFNVSLFIILIKKKGGKILSSFLIKPFIPKKYRESFDQSFDSLYEDIPRIQDMFWPFILEIFIWLTAGLQVYIIALAFNIEVSFYIIILTSIIATIFTAIIPISTGGLGIREGVFVFLMISYGIDADVAFVISLGGFIVKMVIPGIIGLIISLIKKDE